MAEALETPFPFKGQLSIEMTSYAITILDHEAKILFLVLPPQLEISDFLYAPEWL